jgi:uncharacterized glyoxalase superfamily protein PhnB
MPSATIIPELAYPGVSEAVAWLCDAFGFAVRLRIEEHRAQLTFGGGAIVVTQRACGSGAGSAHGVMVRVEDVDAHYERARQHGAEITSFPTDYPYDERQYSAIDPGGHRSQSIADVHPEAWGGTLEE